MWRGNKGVLLGIEAGGVGDEVDPAVFCGAARDLEVGVLA